MNVSDLIKSLSEIPGPSGFEDRVREEIKDVWSMFSEQITVDRIGSLIAVKNGQGVTPRNRILLAAHMDEIGLMVKKIVRFPEDDGVHGYLLVTPVGGVDRRHIYGQNVTVHGTLSGDRDLYGIVGALPMHMLEEEKRKQPYAFDDLVIDLGVSADEVEQMVAVGDFASFRQTTRKLLGGRLAGKALDNRVSVAAVSVCLEYLADRKHDWDVVAVATAQEETRLLGAFTSTYSQRPDIAIAVDVNFAKGPGTTGDGSYELGSGPTIAMGPFHPGITEALQSTAKSLEMKFNLDPHTTTNGTDAFALQIAREGIPTGLVGIPLRYMHTMVETVDTADVERAGRLLGEFIAQLDEHFLSRTAKEMMEE
jgi:putative aminopeptidase FrvX